MTRPRLPIPTDAPPPPRLHPAFDRALILVFLVVIALPATATILGLDREGARGENRALAALPALQWSRPALAAYPAAFTRYFEDNFAFRARLVRWQAAFRLFTLKVSPTPAVIMGRDGWLFYADDGAMDDYALAPPFSVQELEIWRRTLEHTSDWLRTRGIAYVFVVAPDKHAIYPEAMPLAIRPHAHSRIDQLARYLADHSTVRMLDLRPALLEAKRGERIYHLTDTHWNDRGAFTAYREIVGALGRQRPALQPAARSLFEDRDIRTPGLDLAGMLGLTDVLTEPDLTLVPRQPRSARVVEPLQPEPHGIEARLVTELDDARRPRAVMFRDSFGSALIPFLSEHFSRAVYLWQYNVDPAVIAQEHPDVVIQEWVGRRLSTLLPYDPFAAEEGLGNQPSAMRPHK